MTEEQEKAITMIAEAAKIMDWVVELHHDGTNVVRIVLSDLTHITTEVSDETTH